MSNLHFALCCGQKQFNHFLFDHYNYSCMHDRWSSTALSSFKWLHYYIAVHSSVSLISKQFRKIMNGVNVSFCFELHALSYPMREAGHNNVWYCHVQVNPNWLNCLMIYIYIYSQGYIFYIYHLTYISWHIWGMYVHIFAMHELHFMFLAYIMELILLPRCRYR